MQKIIKLLVILSTFWLMTGYAATYEAAINVPVANMYKQPKQAAAMISQAIYGTHVLVRSNPKSAWILIHTDDGYQGWTPKVNIFYRKYPTRKHVAEVTNLFANIYQESDTTTHVPLLTVPFGARLAVVKVYPEKWMQVELVDGQIAWIQKGDVTVDPKPLSMAEMLQLGHKFVGLPYLWAGDSTFGYDCSGIVQAMYAQMGVTLPRDGKQQAGWPGFYQVAEKDLKPGDALYFGWNNDISHAGLYLGNHKFLNSTAYQDPTVHISDLRAPHWRDIYITARRLKPNWRQYQGHGLAAAADFKATTQPLPAAVKQQMQKYTWHKGCPVPLSNLAYLQLSYWGFDNQAHQGALIVNKNLAPEITTIFKDLYQHKFPIAKMKPMYLYHGNDQVSMRANNTSAFNCRAQTNFSKIFSIHSYGGAIDINPLINPYVYGNKVEPAAAKKYLGKNVKGSITPNGIVVKDFTKKGWVWGGSWTGKVRDYQHFEKPLGS